MSEWNWKILQMVLLFKYLQYCRREFLCRPKNEMHILHCTLDLQERKSLTQVDYLDEW